MAVRAATGRLAAALLGAALCGCGGAPPPGPVPVPGPADGAEPAAALLELADGALREGDRARARQQLERVLERDRSHAVAHERLAELTGNAPPGAPRSLAEALEIADRHPYDPRAVFRAGSLLAESGQGEAAALYLERVLWLGDLDPASAQGAALLLPEVDPAWRERRVIEVHVFADERVRARPGWRFRLRTLWLAASNSLREVLDARFVPHSIAPFRAEGSGTDLEAIHTDLWGALPQAPRRGILAAFTGQPEPAEPGVHERGLAEFVGRRTTLRLDFGDPPAELRVLAHEILHLFGGVHVAADVESLMNPTGEALVLDPYNLRIARALRARHFGGAGPSGDVLPWVDLAETRAAFADALAANLTYRRLGLERARRTSEFSGAQAAREWSQARQLDPHLGDVTRFLAELCLAEGLRADALTLMETAEELYGRQSPAGRDAGERADALRRDAGAAAPAP